MSPKNSASRVPFRKWRLFLTGLYVLSGTLHIVKPEIFNKIIPPYLPGDPTAYTVASGVAELGVAAAMTHPKTRKWGGYASAALLLAVWPANFEMFFQRLDGSPAEVAATAIRLPLQIPMIWASWRIAKTATPAKDDN